MGAIDSLPDIDNVSLPSTEQLVYSVQQAVLPRLEFDSNGTITSFSALTVLIALDSFLNFIPHSISFTIWRPRGQGLYDLVGHSVLKFGPSELRAGLIHIDNSSGLVPDNLAFFKFIDAVPDPLLSGPISFQPGDVLGWNPGDQQNQRPLSLVYMESNTTGAIDGFSLPPSDQVPCSVSKCDTRAGALSSIIPYFSVQYGKWSVHVDFNMNCCCCCCCSRH